MPDPKVSIVILNYQSPEVIDVCLRTLEITGGIDYETVVVDNGSEPHVVEALRQHHKEGRITTLVESPENLYFSGGNNLGKRHANPASEYILLLNSDVGFLRPDWLTKLVGWMEGTTEYRPTVWASKPTTPSPGPRDLVSCGWSHDANVEPGHIRPEGWCMLIRRTVWVDLNEAMPWHGGFEWAVSTAIRRGAKCGVLFNYAPFLVHREGGSGRAATPATYREQPDYAAMFNGLDVEGLDFSLGPDEHSSYLRWD